MTGLMAWDLSENWRFTGCWSSLTDRRALNWCILTRVLCSTGQLEYGNLELQAQTVDSQAWYELNTIYRTNVLHVVLIQPVQALVTEALQPGFFFSGYRVPFLASESGSSRNTPTRVNPSFTLKKPWCQSIGKHWKTFHWQNERNIRNMWIIKQVNTISYS